MGPPSYRRSVVDLNLLCGAYLYSSGRGIGPSQRHLLYNIQHSQETNIHAPAGFEHAIPASDRPQTPALNRGATGFGFNPLKPELNPICYLLALLAHHFLHVSRIRVKSLTIRLLMLYIYIWSTYS